MNGTTRWTPGGSAVDETLPEEVLDADVSRRDDRQRRPDDAEDEEHQNDDGGAREPGAGPRRRHDLESLARHAFLLQAAPEDMRSGRGAREDEPS